MKKLLELKHQFVDITKFVSELHLKIHSSLQVIIVEGKEDKINKFARGIQAIKKVQQVKLHKIRME